MKKQRLAASSGDSNRNRSVFDATQHPTFRGPVAGSVGQGQAAPESDLFDDRPISIRITHGPGVEKGDGGD
ncbi:MULTISPECIES: hypothetical protein [Stenotrophomonas]|uniref:hypothetical protein n=1 Tax=Stenotrophomonas pavanii TaxID=487698 RepID=UPI0018A20776